MLVPTLTTRALDPVLVERFARSLVDTLDNHRSSPHEVFAFGLLDGPDGMTAALRPLGGADPVQQLVGFTPSSDWLAAGVAASGQWYPITEPDEAAFAVPGHEPRESPEGGNVAIVHLATRDGALLSVLSRDEGPEGGWRSPDHYYGRVDDVCRRVMGMPTVAPERDTRKLWAVVWCDIVASLVLDGGTPTWPQLALAHPAIGQLGITDPVAQTWAVDNLIRLGNDLGRMHTWDDLLTMCAHNQWPMTGVEPDAAAWMDAGMFSRWCLEPYPELVEILDDVSVLLPDDTAFRLARAIEAWGLP